MRPRPLRHLGQPDRDRTAALAAGMKQDHALRDLAMRFRSIGSTGAVFADIIENHLLPELTEAIEAVRSQTPGTRVPATEDALEVLASAPARATLLADMAASREDPAVGGMLADADAIANAMWQPLQEFGFATTSRFPRRGWSRRHPPETNPSGPTFSPRTHHFIVVPDDYNADLYRQASVAHEIAHLAWLRVPGLARETARAMELEARPDLLVFDGGRLHGSVAQPFSAWLEEIFCDAMTVALLGPSGLRGLVHSFKAPDDPDSVTVARALGDGTHAPHPPAHLRVHMAARSLGRMGFDPESQSILADWDRMHEQPDSIVLPCAGGLHVRVGQDLLLEAIFPRLEAWYDAELPCLAGFRIESIPGWMMTPGMWAQVRQRASDLASGRPFHADGRLVLAAAIEARRAAPDAAERIARVCARRSLGEMQKNGGSRTPISSASAEGGMTTRWPMNSGMHSFCVRYSARRPSVGGAPGPASVRTTRCAPPRLYCSFHASWHAWNPHVAVATSRTRQAHGGADDTAQPSGSTGCRSILATQTRRGWSSSAFPTPTTWANPRMGPADPRRRCAACRIPRPHRPRSGPWGRNGIHPGWKHRHHRTRRGHPWRRRGRRRWLDVRGAVRVRPGRIHLGARHRPLGRSRVVDQPQLAGERRRLYRAPIDCETGAVGEAEKVIEAKNPSDIVLYDDGRGLLVGREVPGAGAGADVALLDLESGAVLAGSDAFGDEDAIVSHAALTDSGWLLMGDHSEFSGIPNRIAAVPVDGDTLGTAMVIPDVLDPIVVVPNPVGPGVLVPSGYGDRYWLLAEDSSGSAPWTLAGPVTATDPSPVQPLDHAVVIPRGSLAGRVLAVEVGGIRTLELEPAGGARIGPVLALGTGYSGLPGAIGVQP